MKNEYSCQSSKIFQYEVSLAKTAAYANENRQLNKSYTIFI